LDSPVEITSGAVFRVEFQGKQQLTRMEVRHSPRPVTTPLTAMLLVEVGILVPLSAMTVVCLLVYRGKVGNAGLP
jgi:hypothetical protein